MTLDASTLRKLRELREASHDNDDFAEKFWEIVPQLLDAYEKLQVENAELKELLADLDMVLKTAMHNGHHDLIQRVSDVVKGCK